MDTVEITLLDARTCVLYNGVSHKSISIGEDTMEIRLLKSDEVAETLQISRSMAYALMKRGDIPTVRIGTSVRVRPEDLEKYIKDNVTQKNVFAMK
jgi:excisionase family DNA binding protein